MVIDIAYIGINPPKLPGYVERRVKSASFPITYGDIADTIMEFCIETLPVSQYGDTFPRAVYDAFGLGLVPVNDFRHFVRHFEVGLGRNRSGSDEYPSKSPVLFVVFVVRDS